MTDYVAFNKENKPYSIHDIEKILKNIPDYRPNLYCICNEPVFYKKNSIEFKNKYGQKIQRINHFSHYPDSNCNVKQIKALISKAEKVNNAPQLTEIEKRILRLNTLLWCYNKSYKEYITSKQECKEIIEKAKKNNIDYENFLSPFIIKLISIKTNNEYISYKDIETLEIDKNIMYHINEFNLFMEEIKKKENFNKFFYQYINMICNDFERFINYQKNLSLIIIYYSRCIKGNDTIKKEIELFKNQVQYKIDDKLKDMFIDDD